MHCDECGNWNRHCITLDGRNLCEECVQTLVDGLRAQVPASDLARRFAALPEEWQWVITHGGGAVGDIMLGIVTYGTPRCLVMNVGTEQCVLHECEEALGAAEWAAKHMLEVPSP